jgi:hypothetical protein
MPADERRSWDGDNTAPDAAAPGDSPDTLAHATEDLPVLGQPGDAPVPLGAGGQATLAVSPAGVRDPDWPALGRPHVPGYEVGALLGRGTYGEVWEAREQGTGIRVAVKFFAHGTGRHWQLLQEEVQRLAALAGVPGIVQLKHVCTDAVPPYYVMAFAEQGSLAQRLKKGPLPLAEAVALFRQVAEALACVHAKGLRHCDLKPGNILLDVRGRPLIADFGQAHFSDDASPALGTFFYMAPEQADLGRRLPDTRWDVYGLGALFYAMVAGRPPRLDETLHRQLEGTTSLPQRLQRYRDVIRRAPRPTAHRRALGMDAALADLIDRCLELDPDRRPRDAGAVLEALECRARRQRQRPLLLFGVLASVLLVFMALVSLGVGAAALDNAREELTRQVLARDEAGAGLVADVVRDQLAGLGCRLSLAVGLLTTGLWAGLFWMVRRREPTGCG